MSDYKREELIFDATITAQDFVIENIFCRIYLPVKVADQIEIRFYPDKEQAKKLENYRNLYIFSLRGEIRDYLGAINKIISSERIISNGISRTFYGVNANETKWSGTVLDLMITHYVNHQNVPDVFEGVFTISHNPLLKSSFIFDTTRIGEIRFEHPKNFKFRIDENVELTFEDVYKRCKNDQDDNVHFFETIASFLVEDEQSKYVEINEILAKLDDILLLSSFAARQRCFCFGWSTYDTKTSVIKYLRNKSKPNEAQLREKLGDLIVELAEFKEFMNVAYKSFKNFPDLDVLRRIINFAIPNEKKTIVSSFVSLYAALEMLVSHYRKGNDLEFILENNPFKKVRNNLKIVIEELGIDDTRKKMMKDKLSELNRVPFVTAFNAFCDKYSVELQDLWSVTDNTNGITLAQVRNKLVHGEHFTREDNLALTYARDHLQWTVERMILGVLTFPYISCSKISNLP